LPDFTSADEDWVFRRWLDRSSRARLDASFILRHCCPNVLTEQGRKTLKELDLEFVPTEANFILVRVGQAARVYEQLLKKGIIVRDMTPWKLPDDIRVTISLPEHNERFIRELQIILADR
jgi:histidinol-phosphate aminotransferase